MAPLRHIRRSRRLSHKSPLEVPDYDWQGAASPQLLHGGSDVKVLSSPLHRSPPSPSTTTSSTSPPTIVTHLPFTPGSSHTRNRKEGHIPRPPNAFMIFRSWLWNNDNLKNIERDNRNVSRIAGRYWNELSEAERAPFRRMADEAKARHAQLYPQYRYSPASQKKPKISQRRTQRIADAENEKCKRVADMLLGGVTGHNLTRYPGEGNRKVLLEKYDFASAAEGASSESFDAAPRDYIKRSTAPRGEPIPPPPRSGKQKVFSPSPFISTPPFQYEASFSFLPATEESYETSSTAGLFPRTPELVYPPNAMEEFVVTDDIPYLSLDSCIDMKNKEDNIPALYPSHLKPGASTVFSGVKPEAASFVDSCILGAHTTDAMFIPSPTPFTHFGIESSSPVESGLAPLGSPVFTNPFDPSTPTAERSALLGTLDQLFGQSISPLTPIFPTENW